MPVFDPAAMIAPLAEAAAALREDTGAPAALVAAALGGRFAAAASGVADLATGLPARADARFEIGSQTKTMTATVVLQLVAEGRLDLDARAAGLLPPDVTDGIANADVATLRQLLSMTGGLPNYTEAVGESGLPRFIEILLAGEAFGPDEALAIARTMADDAPPAGVFSYSNTGYVLLGRVIEAVTGQPLADVFRERIFDPLGMRDTAFAAEGAAAGRLSGYAPDPEGGAPFDVTGAPADLFAEGGVVSTLADMIRFYTALVEPGVLLTPSLLSAMTDFAEVARAGDFAIGYGLGLVEVAFDDGRRLVGYLLGETLGAASSTLVDPDSGLAVAAVGSLAGAAVDGAGLALAALLPATTAWDAAAADAPGPLIILSGSAAEARLVEGPEGLVLSVAGAQVAMTEALRGVTSGELRFADGSVLVVGDDRPGLWRDDRANDTDIFLDYPAARFADNQLLGLGGDDRLGGALGDDRLLGGAGDDILRGRGGDDALAGGDGDDRLSGGWGADRLDGGDGADRLWGGGGADRLDGGAGRDWLAGGAGADLFVFADAADSPAGPARDTIADFVRGEDRIDLTAIDAVPDGGDDPFAWIGRAAFGGSGGELRMDRKGSVTVVQADLDGDGSADLEIALPRIRALSDADFIL